MIHDNEQETGTFHAAHVMGHFAVEIIKILTI